MPPIFQGRHYVEAVKKCRFYFLRVLYAACSPFMQQTHETIFRIHKASCSLEYVHTIASMIMANKMNPENIISNLS